VTRDLSRGGSGRCLCGAVTYAFDGPPNWQAHCHCESCRRATASPFTSFFGISHGRWRWTGALPASFASSPGVTRSFCGTCGSPMAYQGRDRPDEIDFYAATLTDPGAYAPTLHVHWNERLPWLTLADGLPRQRSERRMTGAEDFAPALALIRASFTYMEGRIDPPSSVHRLTLADLARSAETGEVWVIEDPGRIIACVVLTPRPDHLYLGKLAVAPDFRQQGLARQLVERALVQTRARGLPELRLETRVELTENHATFRALGFRETGRTAHPGHDRPTSLTFSRAP